MKEWLSNGASFVARAARNVGMDEFIKKFTVTARLGKFNSRSGVSEAGVAKSYIIDLSCLRFQFICGLLTPLSLGDVNAALRYSN